MKTILGALALCLAFGAASAQEQGVTDIQSMLEQCGFNPGPVDGLWGATTAKAAAAFVKAHGDSPVLNDQSSLMAQVDVNRVGDAGPCPTGEPVSGAVESDNTQALADSRESEYQMIRIACQHVEANGELIDRVLIIEQLSTEATEKDLYSSAPDHFDGVELITPGLSSHMLPQYTYKAPFRMRAYNQVSLVSPTKSRDQIVKGLLQTKASKDLKGFLMDYQGLGYRYQESFIFTSTGPYDFVKEIEIDRLTDLENLKGWMTINLTTGYEDGPYVCDKPVLISAQ